MKRCTWTEDDDCSGSGVIGEAITTRERLLDTAHRAEALGYSTLLLRDHVVAEPFGDQLAPLVALMAVAGATRTLRVGSLVLTTRWSSLPTRRS